MRTASSRDVNPWYREPWPWIIMAGPAAVVVAGIATAVIAWTHQDALVADDYYKRGLAINRVLAREETASRLGLTASVALGADGTRVRVTLRSASDGPGTAPMSPPILRFIHPTRDGADQDVTLRVLAPGVFEGSMRPLSGAHWQVQLGDAAGVWRLSGLLRRQDEGVVLGKGGL